MLILVINCGSSSIKYKLFDMKAEKAVIKGVANRVGDIKRILNENIGRIDGIGHRVVHGGEDFKNAVLINNKVAQAIERAGVLAPLHNPPALEGIRAASTYFPGIKQVAVFDTAFHQSMPPHAYLYGIPFRYYKKYKIRRYGFHGTSHRYIAAASAKKMGKPLGRLKLITAHLGNGCSMTAIRNGRPVDTTMGFTPLEGLLMGTRSGDLDPAVVTYLMEKERLGVKEINVMLNKRSGLLGISGISNDMRDILKKMKKGNIRARLAFDIFVYRVKKYIGAYAVAMGGLDAVVLTGGIGENAARIKSEITKSARSSLGKKVKVLTIRTNEELMIARDTFKLIRKETK